MAPIQAYAGYVPSLIPGLPDGIVPSPQTMHFTKLAEVQEEALALLRDMTDDASAESKFTHDQSSRSQTFEVGDLVMLYVHNLRPRGKKLDARWAGPFKITEVVMRNGVNQNNYRLDLPVTFKRLANVFHTTFLKPYKVPQDGQRFHDRPGPIPELDEDVYEMASIVGHRFRLAHDRTEIHVHWANYATEDDTWEPVENFLGTHAKKILKEYIASHPNDGAIRLTPIQMTELEAYMALECVCESPLTGSVMAVITTL
jgi:hypothetical protein